jgi:hypothetical protein
MGSDEDDGGGDDEEELEADTQLHYVQICTLRNWDRGAHSLGGKIHSLLTAGKSRS